MNQACVSLDEVLAAAGVRAASLVPETSGYLALAVADATSRLPYVHDDRGVLLTIDGSVMVPRKPGLTSPPDAARGIRDLLRRLLAASTGSMPGLTSAARPRGDERDVDRVVGDVEAALIPVNRAAAKRALARLAREALRAKELGKLKKKSAPPPATAIAPPATVVVPAATAAAPPPAIAIAPPAIAIAPPALVVVPAATAAAQAPAIAAAPPAIAIAPPALVVMPPASIAAETARVERLPVIVPPALVVVPPAPVIAPPVTAAVEKAMEVRAITPAPIEIDVEISPEPERSFRTDSPWGDNDATIADPEAMAVIEASCREAATPLTAPDLDAPDDPASPSKDEDSLTRPWGGRVAPVETITPARWAAANRTAPVQDCAAPEAASGEAGPTALLSQLSSSRADELLDAFRAEDEGDPAVLAAASSLRAFAGVDEPGAPRPEPQQRPSYLRPPPIPRRGAASLPDIEDDLPLPAPRAKNPAPARWPLALFALGVLVLFTAWLYRPTLAHDFFGLAKLVRPTTTEPAAAPASSDQAAPEPAIGAPSATPLRGHDARASAGPGDGPHRRRD